MVRLSQIKISVIFHCYVHLVMVLLSPGFFLGIPDFHKNMLIYADDLNLVSSTATGLQSLIDTWHQCVCEDLLLIGQPRLKALHTGGPNHSQITIYKSGIFLLFFPKVSNMILSRYLTDTRVKTII